MPINAELGKIQSALTQGSSVDKTPRHYSEYYSYDTPQHFHNLDNVTRSFATNAQEITIGTYGPVRFFLNRYYQSSYASSTAQIVIYIEENFRKNYTEQSLSKIQPTIRVLNHQIDLRNNYVHECSMLCSGYRYGENWRGTPLMSITVPIIPHKTVFMSFIKIFTKFILSVKDTLITDQDIMVSDMSSIFEIDDYINEPITINRALTQQEVQNVRNGRLLSVMSGTQELASDEYFIDYPVTGDLRKIHQYTRQIDKYSNLVLSNSWQNTLGSSKFPTQQVKIIEHLNKVSPKGTVVDYAFSVLSEPILKTLLKSGLLDLPFNEILVILGQTSEKLAFHRFALTTDKFPFYKALKVIMSRAHLFDYEDIHPTPIANILTKAERAIAPKWVYNPNASLQRRDHILHMISRGIAIEDIFYLLDNLKIGPSAQHKIKIMDYMIDLLANKSHGIPADLLFNAHGIDLKQPHKHIFGYDD